MKLGRGTTAHSLVAHLDQRQHYPKWSRRRYGHGGGLPDGQRRPRKIQRQAGSVDV